MPDNVFEVADCHIALGGDIMNTVPRFDVTAAEMAVLQAIHGSDAVHDIKIKDPVNRLQRVERERIKTMYSSAKNSDGTLKVEMLYPGAAARVFERFDELVLDDSQYAAERIVRGSAARQAAAQADADEGADLATMPDAEKPKKGKKSKKAATPAPVADQVDEDDELPADDEPLDAGNALA